ncbi:MAG TPA: S41 family peptidase [Vicinamibacterales bacterium]|nr:S41 family peptidase [Vicinamibacterales bacterium]
MPFSRSLGLGLLTIAAAALAGGVFGHRAVANQDRLPEHYKTFTAALAAIESRYVEPVESDRLVYGAISGMLQTLDPHSSFMDPRAYSQLRERQEGRYYGLGIQIAVFDGDITVQQLFEGSPAYKLGIRQGDIIARIAGEDAKGWTTEQAVQKLRGPKGTTVQISIKRVGFDELITLEVPRDEINIPTIPAYFMVNGDVGYVRLQDFAEHTDRDLGRALEDLTRQGMRKLLLDLRMNPGGPLDQAIKVTNRFLRRGELIVYTDGRVPNSDQEFRATRDGEYLDLPIIVLVNRNSASASEIVSGALQDHDRALIVGETTFGKALVQSIYRVSEGAGLALTTARYYTPSGRLIQRPWDNAFDEYLMYALRDQSTERQHDEKDLKYTDAGRKVYQGGGIEPDRRIEGPIEGFNPSRFGRTLYARRLFSTFAQRFSVEGDTRFAKGNSQRRTVRPDFVVDDAILYAFRQHVLDSGMKIDEQAFAQDLVFIKSMIRFDIDVALFGVATARRHLIETDPQAQLALSLFDDAIKLTRLARSTTVKRAAEPQQQ